MNYFSYFTEVEEHFQRRRGTILLLTTLDWALIETWREAGIPLEAVLRGIDAAFDKRDSHPQRRRLRAVNGLAWCAQAVMEQAQSMQEAAVGAAPATSRSRDKQDGFDRERVRAHLEQCAEAYSRTNLPALAECTKRLQELAGEASDAAMPLESLETKLTALEEKAFAILTANTPDDKLVELRESTQRELAPYRSKMQSAQIAQVQRQMLNKRLLESHNLPRLSLFYMPHGQP